MTTSTPRHGRSQPDTRAQTRTPDAVARSHTTVSQAAERRARSDARSALLEWAAAVTVLLGCAAATAGVIAIVLNTTAAVVLILAGAAAVGLGAAVWTVVVKRRHPRPRAAKREL